MFLLGVPGSFFLHGWQWFFCFWAVLGWLGDMKMGMSMVYSIFGFVAVGSLLYIDNIKNNFKKII